MDHLVKRISILVSNPSLIFGDESRMTLLLKSTVGIGESFFLREDALFLSEGSALPNLFLWLFFILEARFEIHLLITIFRVSNVPVENQVYFILICLAPSR